MCLFLEINQNISKNFAAAFFFTGMSTSVYEAELLTLWTFTRKAPNFQIKNRSSTKSEDSLTGKQLRISTNFYQYPKNVQKVRRWFGGWRTWLTGGFYVKVNFLNSHPKKWEFKLSAQSVQ